MNDAQEGQGQQQSHMAAHSVSMPAIVHQSLSNTPLAACLQRHGLKIRGMMTKVVMMMMMMMMMTMKMTTMMMRQ
jgi:hypothetical protein